MNEHEFTRTVMVYSSKFYGYSYKILGNQEEARDVVQDLYIKLWSMRSNLSNINNIEAFATTIIRNLCIDRLKRIKRGILHSEHYGKQITHYELNSFESSFNDQEFKLELIRGAIKKLPDIQKKVFIMRDFEENEFDFIALELGLTSENVRVILSRARMKIRELIEKSNK
ncbi:MAG: RNA polymerase sigma factor [Tenuifilaceae bacterium]